METDSLTYKGLPFMEAVVDISLFAGKQAKLYVETLHQKGDGGSICLAWQQKKKEWNHFENSYIHTSKKSPTKWQLLESDWFPIPDIKGVSCLWIMGKRYPETEKVGVALASLVITDDDF